MFVVKIGGSILFDKKDQINEKLISKYANTIKNVINGNKKRCTIVVGGGKIARKYIKTTRALGSTEAYNDIIGIESARLNARLLISALQGLAYPEPPKNFNEFQKLVTLTNKVIVCGGFQPGQSTNAVAASIAEYLEADKLINLTDVDGVYSSDPSQDKSAKLLDKINVDEFIKLIASQETRAGHYPLFDYTAAQIVKRSKITVHFVNGNDSENIHKAIENTKIGTIITH